MSQLCDFCKEQRSMIYCRSDAAYLCLSCDRTIHSVNGLSKRHSRSLVCERCNSQIATVRCIQENLSLCQNCNWSELSTPDSPKKYKRETVNSYSGCPTAAELSKIWPFFCFDQSVVIITEKAVMDTIETDVEQFDGIESLNTPHPKDFDNSDIDWSMENCEAHFDESLDNTQQFFDDGGFDNLFGTENFRDPERSEDFTREQQQACRNPVSANTDPNVCCSPRPVQSSFSISIPDQIVDQETSVDQQTEGVSSSVPIIIEEQHPCNDHHLENRLTSTIRDCAVLRYKEKRKSRKFDGKVNYASRKAGAEVRRRVKGRFVKAGDPYDYDPLNLTNNLILPKALL